MHHRAERDVPQRQRVAGLDIGLRPGLDLVALLEALGRQDVAFLAVRVMQQRDIGRAVGIVLATTAGTPSWLRLKSISRRRRLWPPPRWRVVMRPRLLRPPECLSGASRRFSGGLAVSPEKSASCMKR